VKGEINSYLLLLFVIRGYSLGKRALLALLNTEFSLPGLK